MLHYDAVARNEIITFLFLFVDQSTLEERTELSFGMIREVKTNLEIRPCSSLLEIW